MTRRFRLALFTFLTLMGCASQDYRFVAAGPNATGKDQGRGEAFYQEPEGTIRVRSKGLVDLRPKGERERITAFHIRMSLSKASGDKPWGLDTRQQVALFPNAGQAPAIFANSDAAHMPELEIKTGELRTVDMYFPLPAGEKSAKDLSEFDFKWTVTTSDKAITETTSFQRVEYDPQMYPPIYPYEPYEVGFGPSWYYWGTPVYRPPMRVRH